MVQTCQSLNKWASGGDVLHSVLSSGLFCRQSVRLQINSPQLLTTVQYVNISTLTPLLFKFLIYFFLKGTHFYKKGSLRQHCKPNIYNNLLSFKLKSISEISADFLEKQNLKQKKKKKITFSCISRTVFIC